jgi:hypothetical protein
MCENQEPTAPPFIRLVVRGANDLAVSAAKCHGVVVHEDERLHYGRYWSTALEEYRDPDPQLPVWQTTYLLTGYQYLDEVTAWHEQSQVTGLQTVPPDGVLLYLSYESNGGKVITRHIGPVDHYEKEWSRILGRHDIPGSANSPQELTVLASTDDSKVWGDYEP